MKQFKNLYSFELKNNRKSLLIWLITTSLIMILFMSIFPSMGAEMNEMISGKLDMLPDGLKAIVGLDHFLDFGKILPFFGYCFQFLFIAYIVYAISLGAKMVAKEQDKKTVDFLVTKPIKRKYILLAKYMAGFTFLILFVCFSFLINWVILACFNQFSMDFVGTLGVIFILSFVVMWFFYSLSFLLSALLDNSSKVMMISISLFFITYILGIISALMERISFLKWFSPYHIADVIGQTSKTSIPVLGIVMMILCSILCLIGSITIYKKRDLIV